MLDYDAIEQYITSLSNFSKCVQALKYAWGADVADEFGFEKVKGRCGITFESSQNDKIEFGDFIKTGIVKKINSMMPGFEEEYYEFVRNKSYEDCKRQIDPFLNAMLSLDDAKVRMGIKSFPSRTALARFYRLSEADQEKLKDSVSIQITEEELVHAKQFLALVAVTGGQTIDEKSQRDVYVEQGILPENSPAVQSALKKSTLRERVEDFSKLITVDNIKNLYKRLIEKRPLMFMGSSDGVLERPGFPKKEDLSEYICYSEMELSAMLGVSGETFFINDGNRGNKGKPGAHGSYEERGRISALVGARMEIDDGMEAAHLIPGQLASLVAKGKGKSIGRIEGVSHDFINGYQMLYNEGLYGGLSGSESSNGRLCDDRLVRRLEISYKKLFADAIKSLSFDNKAYIRVVGLGDGVWSGGNGDQVSHAIGKAVRNIFDSLEPDQKAKIAAIEFSQYGHENYFAGFKGADHFLDSGQEIQGVAIVSGKGAQFSNKLPPRFEGANLCVDFAWDGGSYVGNEYWHNMLSASGDPAAVCCSAIGVTMNPVLNERFLGRVEVVTKNCDTIELSDALFKEPEVKLEGPGKPSSSISGIVEYEALNIKSNESYLEWALGKKVTKIVEEDDRTNSYIVVVGTKDEKVAKDFSQELATKFGIKGQSGQNKYPAQFKTDAGGVDYYLTLKDHDVSKIKKELDRDAASAGHGRK